MLCELRITRLKAALRANADLHDQFQKIPLDIAANCHIVL